MTSEAKPHSAAAAITAGMMSRAFDRNSTTSEAANSTTASTPTRLIFSKATVVPAISPTTPAVRPSIGFNVLFSPSRYASNHIGQSHSAVRARVNYQVKAVPTAIAFIG
jgi:hypothetical protein